MAMLAAFIPKGYSEETKQKFIRGCERCESEGLKLAANFEHVYLHEFDTDHCDETMRQSKLMLCYTAEKKGLVNKADFVRLFKKDLRRGVWGSGHEILYRAAGGTRESVYLHRGADAL